MDHDVIIIGSGAGGLATAVPLAQAGRDVVVVEQHEVPGGWSQSFTLSGYQFSPGVHYVGCVGPGGILRRVYEGLGVSADLEFCEINPDGYDHIIVGNERFDYPKGADRLVAAFQKRFPNEAVGIRRYFETVTGLMEGLREVQDFSSPRAALNAVKAGALVARWAPRTGEQLMDAFVQDPLLKAFLAGQAGDHGEPPSTVSAIMHAAITHHYLDGAYFPRGGGFAIPRAFVRALKRAGGSIRLNTSVERILMDGKRVAGVKLADGEELSAPVVVSNADPHATFERMIGRDNVPGRVQRKLDRVTYGPSALSLFFAVDMDLRAAGLDSGNWWLYDHTDVSGIYAMGATDHVLRAEAPPGMFLAAPTLKDPSKMHGGHHTCEAFAFVNYDAFKRFAHEQYGDRSKDYEALKADLAEKMFTTLEKHVPGLRDHVVYWNLATPLTNVHYVKATRGNLYGLAKTRGQVGPGAFPVKSAVPGLYMVGANTVSHGVMGATMTGLTAASSILGCRVRDLFKMDGPPLTIYPSEDVTQWPPELQERIARRQKPVPAAAR